MSDCGALLRELYLPGPYSVNAMRKTNLFSKREYRQWQKAAHAEIMAQGPRRMITVPVVVEMAFGAGAVMPKFDTDNGAKCMLDALVAMGILEDDTRRHVPVIVLRWHSGMQTIIKLYEFTGRVL